jgi:hypothetical protein
MVVFSDTDIAQAKLVSQLSGRPAKIHDDVFIWNGHMIDRATAVVAFLKINNQVPVGDGIKMRLHQAYDQRFAAYDEQEELVNIADEQPDKAARIWFNILCRKIKGKSAALSHEEIKRILIDLHS